MKIRAVYLDPGETLSVELAADDRIVGVHERRDEDGPNGHVIFVASDDDPRIPMAAMSRAIRLELEKHAPRLQELPDEILVDYVRIVSAYAADLLGEQERREEARLRGLGLLPDPPEPA